MRNLQTFFKVVVQFYTPTDSFENLVLSVCSVFILAILGSVKLLLTGFSLHLPVASGVGPFFVCSLSIRKSTLVKCLFKYFTYSLFLFDL